LSDIGSGIEAVMRKPLMLLAIGLAGLVLGLAGCGDDNGGGSGTTTNDISISVGTTTDGVTTGGTTTNGTTTDGTTTDEDDDDGGGSGEG
jgi:hypothetical protein